MAYYDYIRVYGLAESQLECFQGLGSSAQYNAEADQPVSGGAPITTNSTTEESQTPTAKEPCPPKLWAAQDEMLKRQCVYLKDIKETYAERRIELQGFNMREFTESEWFKWAVDVMLKLIPGDTDDFIYELVQKYALKTIGWCLVWLQKAYLSGSLLCAAMFDENCYLLTELKPTIDNYKLRSSMIAQHDMSIQSLLQQVSLAETQAQRQQDFDAEKEFFKKEALSERIFECPYSGLCLGEKNRVADESEFDILNA